MPLPLPPQTYSVDDQAQTRSQISQVLARQQAEIGRLSAEAATWPAWDLRHYAALAGITLGSGNDQPAFDAAHAAMAARPSQKTLLYVHVPPGAYDVDQLLIYNAAGFYCDPGTALLRQKPWTAPTTDTGLGPGWGAIAAKPFVRFATYDSDDGTASSACSWLLYGFKLDGGWSLNWSPGPVDETDPALFHYAVSAFSGGDPDRNAHYGQTAVLLRGAFDPPENIGANSPFRSPDYNDARFLVGELDICGFGGDGFHLQGAGAGVIGPIRTYTSGGRGIVLNSYDNKVGLLDGGGNGLEGMVLHNQFADATLAGAKLWFSGLRKNAGVTANGGLAQDAGHDVGCWLDGCGALQATIQVQDSVGSAFRIAGCEQAHLDLHADYAGLPPAMQTADCGGIDFGLGRFGLNATQGGFIRFSVSPALVDGVGPYPHFKYVLNAHAPLMATVVMVNQYNMPTANPGDAATDFVDPAWLASGDLALITYPTSLPTSGQTLTLNGATVTFGSPAGVADVAAAINAAAIAGVSASTIGSSALTLTSTTGSPAALTIGGSAATDLKLTVGTTTSQSYYDTALIIFGTSIRAPRSWMANSGGYINFGLGYAGLTATAAGVASVVSAGRTVPVSLGHWDPAADSGAGAFKYPVYAELDVSGNQQISFLGQYPPAPMQSLGSGPLPVGTATDSQRDTAINTILNLLQTFGLGNYGL